LSRAELNSLMKQHFVIAAWARDSLIDGALEAVRAPLRALSDYGYETFPLAWMGGIARLQASARQTANAESLEAAASGIATLAGICGRCHLDQGHVLPLGSVQIAAETPQPDGITTRMSRHAWAVERLWAGLVAPSDESWRAGAAALEHAPLRTPKPNSTAPHDFARDFAELRTLGARARNEDAPDMRVELYGKMLATCSRCHAHVDEHERIRALSAQP
jgi:cytochrome c553